MNILLTGKDQDGEVPKSRVVEQVVLTIPNYRVCKESIFDTKKYRFYFTEVWKEKT
jgi:hypothetical protein